MSEYQEEVLTNILDLQAELRGDEPEPHDTAERSPAPANGVGVNDRLAALNERLARLEYDLAGVTKRIERIEPEPEMHTAEGSDTDVDGRWRSFLDLQKIVANRLDQR